MPSAAGYMSHISSILNKYLIDGIGYSFPAFFIDNTWRNEYIYDILFVLAECAGNERKRRNSAEKIYLTRPKIMHIICINKQERLIYIQNIT